MAGQDSDPIIKIYLREIMGTPLLTAQQEIELAARIKKGDQEARALIIQARASLSPFLIRAARVISSWGVNNGTRMISLK